MDGFRLLQHGSPYRELWTPATCENWQILSLAPNYDNNIALIAKDYPSDVSRKSDGLIRFFREFVMNCPKAHEMYRQMELPEITAEMIDECMDDIPIEANRDFIRSFILNGQERIREIIIMSEIHSEDEDNGMGMML